MKRARSEDCIITLVSKEGSHIPVLKSTICRESKTICDLLEDSPDTTEIPLVEFSKSLIVFIVREMDKVQEVLDGVYYCTKATVPSLHFVTVAKALNYLHINAQLDYLLKSLYLALFCGISKGRTTADFFPQAENFLRQFPKDLMINHLIPMTASVDLFAVRERYPEMKDIALAELTKRAGIENLFLDAYYDLVVTFEGKPSCESGKECMEDYRLTYNDTLKLPKPIMRKDALLASLEKHKSMGVILLNRKIAYEKIVATCLEKRAMDKLLARFGKQEFQRIVASWE